MTAPHVGVMSFRDRVTWILRAVAPQMVVGFHLIARQKRKGFEMCREMNKSQRGPRHFGSIDEA